MIAAVVGKNGKPGQLAGQLANELSQLVRMDVELAAAERLPELRRAASEVAVAAGGLIALLFAVAALSWAGGIGLTHAIPSWSAALVIAGVWLIIAAVLLRHDYARKLRNRFSTESQTAAITSNQAERKQAEQEIRQTAERLAEALLKEAETQGVRAASTAAEHGIHAAEHEASHLLHQLAEALRDPGKAGLSLLERLKNVDDKPEP
jgi:hypothetical protein